jgi:hypothetical protein
MIIIGIIVFCILSDILFSAGVVVAFDLTNIVERFPSISKRLETCTLEASGGDDGPPFAAAILSDQCSTINIPVGTTLSIASPVNTTATYNKLISLMGTLSFTDDTVSAHLAFVDY